MIVAVFSDVHGNLIALNAFLEQVRQDADAYLCLGDVVNYGPWSNECLEIISALPNIVLVRGNHEKLFSNPEESKGESQLVQSFFEASYPPFTRADLLSNLPTSHVLGPFTCIHTIANQSIYADTQIVIDRDYLIGHTHHQFRVWRGDHQIVSPGSLGQNRRFIDLFDYALLDTETYEVEFFSGRYDVDSLLSEMKQRQYPDICIRYYERKPRFG
jgi:predicted phosphodiesterase